MKIKIVKVEEVEVDVSDPTYRKSSVDCLYYKVISEEKALQVTLGAFTVQIGTVNASAAWNENIKMEDTTQEVFEAAYYKALLQIKELVTIPEHENIF